MNMQQCECSPRDGPCELHRPRPTDPAAGHEPLLTTKERQAIQKQCWRDYPADASAALNRYETTLAAAETARDQARDRAADAMMAHGLAVESLRHVEAECKRDMAACEGHRRQLAALETAARALVYGGRPVLFGVQAIHEALEALTAPPGES